MSASKNAAGRKNGLTPFQSSHYIAERLEGLGYEPYQSINGRYLVLMQDSPGEIFNLGRPLKGSRFFSKNAIRKDRKTIAEFEQFAEEDGLKNCYYWGIGLPCAKSTCDGLEDALRQFNSIINNEFTFLRTRYGFEMLLLTIHIRYDRFSELIDLHAHFICRVEDEHALEPIKHHLRRKFSKYDFPLDAIRSAGACATYMHSGIFDNNEMVTWPDEALAAAWKATENRFRFSRVGGAFAQWRVHNAAANGNPDVRAEKQRIRDNRRETADPRQLVASQDKFLGKVMATVRGTKVYALLFENTSRSNPAASEAVSRDPRYYSSATGVATQNPDKGLRQILKNAVNWLMARSDTSPQCDRPLLKAGQSAHNASPDEQKQVWVRTPKIWKSFTILLKTVLARIRVGKSA